MSILSKQEVCRLLNNQYSQVIENNSCCERNKDYFLETMKLNLKKITQSSNKDKIIPLHNNPTKIINLSKEIANTQKWLERIQKQYDNGEPLHFPHLTKMGTKDRIVTSIKNGYLEVQADKIEGAWVSTFPELEYGHFGLQLDERHGPNSTFNYRLNSGKNSIGDKTSDTKWICGYTTSQAHWIGFKKPFVFKEVTKSKCKLNLLGSKVKLNLAGVIIDNTKDGEQIKKLCKRIDPTLPDDIFISERESLLRSYILNTPALYLSPYENLDRYVKGNKDEDRSLDPATLSKKSYRRANQCRFYLLTILAAAAAAFLWTSGKKIGLHA